MAVNDRIKIILSTHGISASEFALELGIQRSAVSHLLSGRNKPSLDMLEKILKHYPRVNAHWLITGEAPRQMEFSQEEDAEKQLYDSDIDQIVVFYKDGSFKAYSGRQE